LDLDGRAVIPGLVNAHTHLELSALSGLFQEISPGDYLGWVRKLMFKRNTLSEGEIYKAFADAAKKCADEGTAIVGDVSNIPLVKYFNAENRENLPWRYLFWEWIGFTVMSIRQLSPKASRAHARHPQEEGRGSLTSFGMTGLSNGKTWVDQFSIVSHAVYSTSAYLIKKTKDWCKKRGRIFSIHVGET
jgi:cytosine/adenosine deaminase-related metal-dependent hydrolase